MGRDTYSESYTSRQEIVPLDKSTQASAKESPPPVAGSFNLKWCVIQDSAHPLRGSAPASPACRRARPRAKNAPRFLYARASTEVRIHAVFT